MEKDFSICISSKNRPHHLKVLFKFLKRFNFRGSVLIADASDVSIKQDLEENFERLEPNFNFKYFRAENLSVIDALLLLSDKIKTSFVMVIGDDDYIIPKAINKACKILKKEKNLLGVTGKAILIDTKSFKINNYRTNGIKGINSEERIIDLLNNYWALHHSVLRTEYFSKIFSKSQFKNKSISEEIRPNIILSSLGNINKINAPFFIRGVGHERNIHPNTTKESLNDFSKIIVSELAIKNKNKQKEINALIRNLFEDNNKKNEITYKKRFFYKVIYFLKLVIRKIKFLLLNLEWNHYTNEIKSLIQNNNEFNN